MNLRQKTLAATILLIAFGSITVFAQTSLTNLLPKNARYMALGGSSLVFAEDCDALWGNPAGLARKKSLTLFDSSTWTYIMPTPLNIQNLAAILNKQKNQEEITSILDGLVSQNGLGGGEYLQFGWISDGFGIGIDSVTDAIATGSGLDDSVLNARTQINAVFGMGWLTHLGPFEINIGANVRGFYRMETSLDGWAFGPLSKAVISKADLYSIIQSDRLIGGFGFAIDAGGTLSIGPFSLGFMVRDLADRFAMKESSIKEIADTYMVPMGGLDFYAISPIYTVGLSLALDQDSLLPVTLFIEADDPLSIFPLFSSNIKEIPSKMYFGIEIGVLKFFALRAGFNQGCFSAGFGIHLLFLDLNAAMFTEPVNIAGSKIKRSGVMLQGAIKF